MRWLSWFAVAAVITVLPGSADALIPARAMAPPLMRPSANGGYVLPNTQYFTSGAGTYAWVKPPGTTFVQVVVFCPGGGGGSGAYGTSDSGGGGGGSGAVLSSTFASSQLNATEDVVLVAGGTGGVTKSSNGSGNQGSDPGEASFGAAARNLVRCNPTQAISGAGGDTASGVAGTLALASYTTVISMAGSVGKDGGAGDDVTTASIGVAQTVALASATIPVVGTSGGGGGGGTNGGANFTSGGAGGILQTNSAVTTVQAAKAGGTTDGQAGTDGAAGGYLPAYSAMTAFIGGGSGGGGGAGAVVASANGGKGGDGGNCGGGGGGGGSSLSGTIGSGVGGNGGAACVFVISR